MAAKYSGTTRLKWGRVCVIIRFKSELSLCIIRQTFNQNYCDVSAIESTPRLCWKYVFFGVSGTINLISNLTCLKLVYEFSNELLTYLAFLRYLDSFLCPF